MEQLVQLVQCIGAFGIGLVVIGWLWEKFFPPQPGDVWFVEEQSDINAEFSQEVLDLTWQELKAFDDGDYYPDEREYHIGFGEFLLFVVSSTLFLMAGLANESWLVAAPGIVLFLISLVRSYKSGDRAYQNRLNRLRTVAQIMTDEEYARQSEEEMI